MTALDNSVAATRWRGVCAYDGTDFYGWQSQVGGNTIQDFLETRLAVIFEQPVRVHGSGRTDSGVHAKAQTFHFDGGWPHGAEKLLRALRSGLPAGIQVVAIRPAKSGFHARYDATGKRYVYRMYQGFAPPMEARYCYSLGGRPLALEAMRSAAKRLEGTHDFTAYSASRGRNDDNDDEDPVKTLYRLAISRSGPRLTLVAEGSGFLYKMVRRLAGALVAVGQGKLTPDEVEAILKTKSRTERFPTAPAKGLCLEKVFYGQRKSRGTS
jgi:tRNA pseudouridine38-40 synthase